jgi:hypothetical protein
MLSGAAMMIRRTGIVLVFLISVLVAVYLFVPVPYPTPLTELPDLVVFATTFKQCQDLFLRESGRYVPLDEMNRVCPDLLSDIDEKTHDRAQLSCKVETSEYSCIVYAKRPGGIQGPTFSVYFDTSEKIRFSINAPASERSPILPEAFVSKYRVNR